MTQTEVHPNVTSRQRSEGVHQLLHWPTRSFGNKAWQIWALDMAFREAGAANAEHVPET